MLDTVASYHETLQLSTQGVKRKLTDENSSSLWHKRLGHISKRRIERLVSYGILDSLDFAYFEICTNCIKGKQTNTRRFGANRATDVLQLIHADICGPFPTVSWNGQQYFITFIDDFSSYGYLYLIMKSPNHWKYSNRSKLKLKINSIKGLKTSDLTVVVNTMESMTVQVNNVRDHLLNSYRSAVSSHNTPCQVLQA